RPDDGVGAAAAQGVGPPRRVPQPGRLCRARRSAARVPARVRRATGGQRAGALSRARSAQKEENRRGRGEGAESAEGASSLRPPRSSAVSAVESGWRCAPEEARGAVRTRVTTRTAPPPCAPAVILERLAERALEDALLQADLAPVRERHDREAQPGVQFAR